MLDMILTKARRACCLLYAGFCAWIPLSVTAQSPAMQYELHYVEKTETYFFRTDLDWEPNQLELLRMMPYTVKDSVIKQVTTDNDIKTTIWHLENTQLEEWMDQPSRTVIDNIRIRSYDAGNNLLMNIPHSTNFLDSYQALKDTLTITSGNIVPHFPMLTNKLKQEFLYNGYGMTNLGGGAVSFSKDSLTVVFNNKKKVLETKISDAEGAIIYYEKRGFAKNNLNQLVPAYELVRSMDTGFPQGLVYKVELTTYPEYSVNYISPLREAQGKDAMSWNLYPNPAQDQIIIEWMNENGAEASWQIISLAGIEMASGQVDSDRLLELDISKFPSGCYIMILRSGGQIERDQFIKL